MYGKYTSQLPATPVTPQMREEIVAYSRHKGQSISETKRQAIAFFLAQNGQNLTSKHSENDQKMTKEVLR